MSSFYVATLFHVKLLTNLWGYQYTSSWSVFADMRKALSRDTEKKSIVPLPHPVRPEDIE